MIETGEFVFVRYFYGKGIKNKLFVDTQPVLYVDAIDVPYEAVQDSDTNEIETDNDKTSSGKIIKFATNKAS